MQDILISLSETLNSLQVELSNLDRENSEEEYKANRLEEVLSNVTRAHNDLIDLI